MGGVAAPPACITERSNSSVPNRPFQLLINRISNLKIFKRNKVPFKNKVYGTLLYFLGLSYRKIGYLLKVSHEAVRLWWRALKVLFKQPKKKKRKEIAVDETKLKLHGRQIYVWAAIDIKTKEILAIDVTKGRSSLDTLLFIKKVLLTCTNKPIIHVDGGPWYPWGIRRAGAIYKRTRGGVRNLIEQWFKLLKSRTLMFYNNVPAKTVRKGFKNVELFLNIFAGFYNLLWRC